MKLLRHGSVFATAAACAIVLAPGASAQQPRPATREHRLQLSGPDRPGALAVHLQWGRITVRSHQADEVRFTVSEEPRRDGLHPLVAPDAYEVRQLDDRIELTAAEPAEGGFEALDVTVLVPAGLDIRLEMDRGGEIVVEDVAGSFQISNLNGSVRLSGISGDALVDAKNGEIRAEFRRLTPGQPLTFATLNGGVYVTLPPSTSADLEAVSATGDVRTDFPVQVVETTPGPLAPRGPAKGRPTVKVRGTMNGGGPLLYIQTFNGPVRLLEGGKS